MTNIRLVVTDLDGTFWSGPETIHPKTRAAVDTLAARGVALLIATGRRLQSVRRGMQPAGLSGPAVLMSGALGADLATGHLWHRAGFQGPAARTVLDAFRAHDLEPVAYVGETQTDAVARMDCASSETHIESFGATLHRDEPDAWVDAGRVVGFGVIGCHDDRLALVAESLGTEANVWHSIDDTYGGWALMVGPPEVTKVTGVAPWCEANGFTPAEVLAVGDGSNDFHLLDWAGMAVAVQDRPTADRPHDAIIAPPQAAGWATLLELI
jgi:hydroxymethylpyrimidine pyrophosphatase-like HAD family hydrolase